MSAIAAPPLTCLPASSPRQERGEVRWPWRRLSSWGLSDWRNQCGSQTSPRSRRGEGGGRA